MKILLIYPYFIDKRVRDDDVSVVPMGLYYIGALLKEQGYQVDILNLFGCTQSSPEIPAILQQKQPDIVGFSILNGNRRGGIEVAEIAKRLNPDVQIVFGGAGATFLWQHLMDHFPVIDYVVVGEGEHTFQNLAASIQDRKFRPLSKIKGLVFRDNGKVRFTGEAPFIKDLDSLPNPARHFVYQHLSLSRGCPGNCTFCGSPRIWGRKIRFHSADYFVDQIELLVKKGVSFFYVSDDTFTLDKKRVIAVCRTILERKLDIAWAAISHVKYIDEEILYWMRLAGCSQISYGVESGAAAIRSCLNKRIQTEQIEKAFHATVSFGILARAYIIYGCPGESRETIQATLDLFDRIRPLGAIFYILTLLPGTGLFDEFKNQFHISDDIWLNPMEDILYFENDPDLTREMVLAFGRQLRTGFYSSLHRYAEAITLVDKKELYEKHADFYAKLGMTFSHGDYARIAEIADRDNIAEKMFTRALQYAPNHNAYLGLAVLQQKKGDITQSIETLQQGLTCFPGSEPLHTCIGISYMNAGQYDEALSHLLQFPESRQAGQYAADCYQALGRPEKAEEIKKRLSN